jgi:hypothetical protein
MLPGCSFAELRYQYDWQHPVAVETTSNPKETDHGTDENRKIGDSDNRRKNGVYYPLLSKYVQGLTADPAHNALSFCRSTKMPSTASTL